MSRWAVGAAALGAVLMVGCTSTPEATPEPSADPSVVASDTVGPSGAESSTERPTALPPVSPEHPIPGADELTDDPALRTSILLTGCEAAENGWQGRGTAANPGAEDATYKVVVFFTDQYSRAVDSSTVDVAVPAGATVDWAAAQEFTAPEGVQCVLRAVSTVSPG